ncbi:hypothetical protein Tco_0729750 [Tanacetum coccineum]|uniref:Uncharacterized protein n=1 Tax=Tanacetum coccineum TaxID=301880 RepID=A0ABQ4YPR4_9ASTR
MSHSVKMMKQFLNLAQNEMQSTSMKIDPSLMMNSLNPGVKLLNALAILRLCLSPEEPHVFTSADDHPALNDHVHTESTDNLEPAKIQYNVIIKSISNVQSSPTIILPSTAVDINPIVESTLQPPVPQGRWSREKHIELVNIIGEPLAGITTRSRVRDSKTALAHEYLNVNFLSEMEPKKLIEALEEEG